MSSFLERQYDYQAIERLISVYKNYSGNELFERYKPDGYDPSVDDFITNFNDSILFDDDSLLIINKPAGVVTYQGDNHLLGVEEVCRYFCDPGINVAHRIDKDTSGGTCSHQNRGSLL